MIRSLLTASAVFILAAGAFAAPAAKHPAKPAAKAASLVCPVTGEKITSIKDAAGSSVYKGKTYYFCCAGCKPEFDKDPQKFVKPAVSPAR